MTNSVQARNSVRINAAWIGGNQTLTLKGTQNIFVNTADGLFSVIKAKTVNTAAEFVTAIQKEGIITMSNEYKKRCKYKQSMMMAKSMLSKDIISSADYAKIDKILAKKYGIDLCSIYRQNA